MNTGLRVGVIGCGAWGKNLVRNFSEMGVLSAVSDIYGPTARDMSERFSVPALSAESLFSSGAADAVAIAVPAEDHADLALQAIAAGKHVFVEKPIAVCEADAGRMAAAAADRNLILMVGHVLRYHPCFRELLEAVRSGKIGRLAYIYTSRADNRSLRRNENALWGFAPHDVSMILALAGEMPKRVAATGDAVPGRPGADIAVAGLEFPGGAKGHVFVSWYNHVKQQELVVAGENGVIVFDDRAEWPNKLAYFPHRGQTDGAAPAPEPIVVERGEPLRIECEHFAECVATGRRPLTDGVEGLDVLRVLAAMTESMVSGDAVRLDGAAAPGARIPKPALVAR